jgi:hypothetical protein
MGHGNGYARPKLLLPFHVKGSGAAVSTKGTEFGLMCLFVGEAQHCNASAMSEAVMSRVT